MRFSITPKPVVIPAGLMTAKELDTYCRMHNKVIQRKKIRQGFVYSNLTVVDDSDEYRVM